jgi:hypothetical protein
MAYLNDGHLICGTQSGYFLSRLVEYHTGDHTSRQTSGSKLVFLRGIMILTVDNQQHEVPLHFILVSGFPGIAPKAYLSMDNDEEVIK